MIHKYQQHVIMYNVLRFAEYTKCNKKTQKKNNFK